MKAFFHPSSIHCKLLLDVYPPPRCRFYMHWQYPQAPSGPYKAASKVTKTFHLHQIDGFPRRVRRNFCMPSVARRRNVWLECASGRLPANESGRVIPLPASHWWHSAFGPSLIHRGSCTATFFRVLSPLEPLDPHLLA